MQIILNFTGALVLLFFSVKCRFHRMKTCFLYLLLVSSISFFFCFCTKAAELGTCDFLVSGAAPAWGSNLSFTIVSVALAEAGQGSLPVVSDEDVLLPGFMVTPYGPFLKLELPGAVVVNVSLTDLYDNPSWEINDLNQNATVVKLKRPLKDQAFCVLVRSVIPGEVCGVTVLDSEPVVQLVGVEGHQGTGSVGWILGGFYAVIQLVGWIATPLFLVEAYASGEHEEVCYCSGVVAYTFTTGLAAIPHLLVWLYIKYKRRLPENQPLLQPEA